MSGKVEFSTPQNTMKPIGPYSHIAKTRGQGGSSGGQREFAPVMARAAIAIGVACVFIETHEDPDNSPSDGPNMIHLDQMPALVHGLMEFDRLAKANPISI
jgi:2-dehydro-3-deoxyphosphooctonate aldolase (KDO 8-P synthase)